jgi:hypothetical protein
MDLADADNEVMAVDGEDIITADDEEVFCISNSWSDANANSSVVR